MSEESTVKLSELSWEERKEIASNNIKEISYIVVSIYIFTETLIFLLQGSDTQLFLSFSIFHIGFAVFLSLPVFASYVTDLSSKNRALAEEAQKAARVKKEKRRAKLERVMSRSLKQNVSIAGEKVFVVTFTFALFFGGIALFSVVTDFVADKLGGGRIEALLITAAIFVGLFCLTTILKLTVVIGIFVGIYFLFAALPVGVTIIIGALIIASAIKK